MGKPKDYSSIIIELVGDNLDVGYDVASNVINADMMWQAMLLMQFLK